MPGYASPLQQRLSDDVADRYTVVRELARGGMAAVYLAQDRKHDRQVALKVLDPTAGLHAGDQRFHREIAVLARLQHPHILPLHDSGEAGGSLYYVMPYVAGESLRQRLQREGALPVVDALRIAASLADALAYAHAQGVVHRDLKPENVLLSGYPPPTGTHTPAGGVPAWHALLCDFGIARLFQQGTAGSGRGPAGERHTRSGHAVGTPVYMSPEQAAGEGHEDGRSDVWALGVLLFEMLTGAPPHDDAPTPAEALRRRLMQPPPTVDGAPEQAPVRAASRPLRRALDAVIGRAAHPDPARRFASASELATALQACLAFVGPRAPGAPTLDAGPLDRLLGRGPLARLAPAARVTLLAGLALAVGVAAGVPLARWLARDGAAGAVDPQRYVVLPFRDVATGEASDARDSAAPAQANAEAALDGRDAEALLLDAFARWTDLPVVSGTRVNDALARRGVSAPRSLDDALAIARELGAGRLVWGEVRRVPRADARGGVTVRAALYDVATPDATMREHRVVVRPALADVNLAFSGLADSLLIGRPRSPAARDGALATTSWAAWRAYDRGHDALARWDLGAAHAAFAEATQRDPEYALAHLWLAQTLAWLPDAPRAEWQAAAARASALAPRLRQREGLSAQALGLMAAGQYDAACGRYARLVARDSLDYVAWYGLGDCRARDSLIVRDETSPSRWRFRSSYGAAIDAYRRVLSNLPSVHLAFGGRAVTALPALLKAQRSEVRSGYYVTGTDTVRMAAFPSVVADTIAFVPWPVADFPRALPHTLPPSRALAVQRNRDVLLDIAQRWARAFPRSLDVALLHAYALEGTQRLEGTTPDAPGALDALRGALRLTADPAARLRLRLAELRVLCKLERFAEARRLADSLVADVARGPAPRDVAPEALAAAAALVGRVDAANTLLSTTSPADAADARWPAALVVESRRYEGWAAVGGPRDSLAAARARVDRALALVPASDRAEAHARFLGRAAVLAWPTLGPAALRGFDADAGYLLGVGQTAAAGDHAGVRRRLDAIAESRRPTGRTAPSSLDASYLEAWYRAWAGDTAGAVATLDATLDSLPVLGMTALADVPQAAALPRAMLLRAALARGPADAARATRWRTAAAALGWPANARP